MYADALRAEKSMIEEARRYIAQVSSNIGILTALQHFGCSTSCIDFSSVFVRPCQGFLDCREAEKVIVPRALKQEMLDYLKENFGISEQSVYLDIHGYIAQKEGYLKRRARQCLEKGLKHHNKEKSPDAIRLYRQATDFQPKCAVIYYEWGRALSAAGDYNKAVPYYNKVYGSRTYGTNPAAVPAMS